MLAGKMTSWPDESNDSETSDSLAATTRDDSPMEAFIQHTVKRELDNDSSDPGKLRELSKGLDWLRGIIDSELERRVESKLLSYKLLYAGYFGSKGRKAKYANNPCAIRDAIRFCKENGLPPPDWTLSYIYGLMLGVERLPSEQDEKRWKTLVKLLDIAAEWDKKTQQGMTQHNIELYFRRRGVSDEAIGLARSFVSEPGEKKVADFTRKYQI